MSENPTILAVHPGALGDVILFGHLLSHVRGRVTLLAAREKSDLLVGLGIAKSALDFDALPMQEIFSDTPPGKCQLPELLGRHDRLISCFPAGDRRAELRLATMCSAADAAFLPVRPPEGHPCHLLDLWLDLLGGGEELAAPSAWPVPPDWCDAGASALRQLGVDPARPYRLLHPGAGAADKCWPLEKFETLARSADQAIFALGPVECDRWDAGQIDSLRERWPVLVCPQLSTLAGVAAGAGAFVGNDSGTAHLAAAIGVIVVVLFGPTRPAQFAPRGPSVHTLAADPITKIGTKEVLAIISGRDHH